MTIFSSTGSLKVVSRREQALRRLPSARTSRRRGRGLPRNRRARRLELVPGPGLTLVIGRNGSGKSSFAEAMEVLFTGRQPAMGEAVGGVARGMEEPPSRHDGDRGHSRGRGRRRRDIRHAVVVGQRGTRAEPGRSSAAWSARRPISGSSAGTTRCRCTGRSSRTASSARCSTRGRRSSTTRVSSVLGLDELTAAQNVLRTLVSSRQKACEGGARASRRDRRRARGTSMTSERASASRPFAAAHRLSTTVETSRDRRSSGRRRAGSWPASSHRRHSRFPIETTVLAAATSLRGRAAGRERARRNRRRRDASVRRSARDSARVHLADYPIRRLPCLWDRRHRRCRMAGSRAREQVDEQRRVAKIAQRERKRLATAVRTAQGLPGDVPAAVQDARGLLDVEQVIAAWRPWVALVDETDPSAAGVRTRGVDRRRHGARTDLIVAG